MKPQASKTSGFSPVGFVLVIGVGVALYFTGGFSWASKRFGIDSLLADSPRTTAGLEHPANDSPPAKSARSTASILTELDTYSLDTDPEKSPTVTGCSDEDLRGVPTEKAKELLDGAYQPLMSSQENKARLFTLGRIILFNSGLSDQRATAMACFRHAGDDGSLGARAYLAAYTTDESVTLIQRLQALDKFAAEGFKPAVGLKALTEKNTDEYLDEQLGDPADKQVPGSGGTVENEDLQKRDLKSVLRLVENFRAYAERPGASPRFLCGLGRAMAYKKKYPEAEELLQEAAQKQSSLAYVYLAQLPKYKEDFRAQINFLRKAVKGGYTDAAPLLKEAVLQQEQRHFDPDKFSNPRLVAALMHHEIASLLEEGVQLTVQTDKGPMSFSSPALTLDYLTIMAEACEAIDPRFIAGAEWSFIPSGGIGSVGRMKLTTGSAARDLWGLRVNATVSRVIPDGKESLLEYGIKGIPLYLELSKDKGSVAKLILDTQIEAQAKKDAQLLVAYHHFGTVEPVKEMYSSIVDFINQYK